MLYVEFTIKEKKEIIKEKIKEFENKFDIKILGRSCDDFYWYVKFYNDDGYDDFEMQTLINTIIKLFSFNKIKNIKIG